MSFQTRDPSAEITCTWMNVIIINPWQEQAVIKNLTVMSRTSTAPLVQICFYFMFFFYNLTNTIISTSVPYPHSIIITPRMRRLENTCQFIRNAVTIHRQQLHNWLVCLLADELDNSGAASEMEDTRQRHLSKWQSRLGGGWGGIMSLDGTSSLARLPVTAMPHSSSQSAVCC